LSLRNWSRWFADARQVQRGIVAAIVAGLAAWYVVRLAAIMPNYGTDFDPIRYAAKLVLRGENPYPIIGPGREVPWQFPLLYPMPAVVLAIPFTAVSIVVARAVFVALSSGLLAFAVTRRAWWPLVVFFSASWVESAGVAQWSPWMLASWYIAALGFVVAAKPNIGLAVLAGGRGWKSAVIGSVLLLAISFILLPRWPLDWLHEIRSQPHIRPLVFHWLGIPLLIAGLRWRDPRARLLLALALVPQNPALYEAVLLFAIPTTALHATLLALLSWGVDWVAGPMGRTNAILLCCYLPALAMLMVPNRRRITGDDNAADAPE